VEYPENSELLDSRHEMSSECMSTLLSHQQHHDDDDDDSVAR
jgi:hypothetical protein